MSFARSLRVVAALPLILPLGACNSDWLRSVAGIDKHPPDEFQVVSRAPLDLPPDYSLRPPRLGAQRPQDTTPIQKARQTVFRAGASDQVLPDAAQTNRTPGENELLKEAGAADAPPDIRQLVDVETSRLAFGDRSFLDSLLFWREKPPPGQVVDPQQEAQRLKENAAQGKPPSDGDTPTVERKKSGGLLESLF